MHIIAITHPLLRLASELVLLARLPLLGLEMRSEVLNHILGHGARLRQDQRLLQAGCLNGELRRFSQRMALLQLGWCQKIAASLVDFDIIVDLVFAFSQQPEHALRSGLVQPVALSVSDTLSKHDSIPAVNRGKHWKGIPVKRNLRFRSRSCCFRHCVLSMSNAYLTKVRGTANLFNPSKSHSFSAHRETLTSRDTRLAPAKTRLADLPTSVAGFLVHFTTRNNNTRRYRNHEAYVPPDGGP